MSEAVGAQVEDLPVHWLPGPDRHGVTLLARQVADAAGVPVVRGHEVPARLHGRPVHLHFSSGLFDSPAAALDVVGAWADRTRLSLTLHDVPQPAEGMRWGRRAAVYSDLVARASAWAVNSRWEATLAAAAIPEAPRDPEVIPLPVVLEPRSSGAAHAVSDGPTVLPTAATSGPRDGWIGVVGWVYPDKGHEEAIELALAMRSRGHALGVAALGGVAAGHDELADDLARLASSLGVPWHVTGYLEDDDLLRAIRETTVPVAAHRHPSASGSVNSWLAAGRRPLLREHPSTVELDDLRPGAHLVRPLDAWPAEVALALEDPARTWLPPGYRPPHTLDDVVRAYRSWWAR
ncbi:glycosyltransferase [Arthrobacter sp. NEB 688]|uniref:glycosyltransferase n=1 Tax=Arthrobacter sp. NEB 688 TaxID=904039 RepID=UPI0015656425|nr:glycosyltransferase [Arthrobacter sp. NEB 688]QKE85737.1 glycosyltransferase [Arthrobacter sp. NEB 688]